VCDCRTLMDTAGVAVRFDFDLQVPLSVLGYLQQKRASQQRNRGTHEDRKTMNLCSRRTLASWVPLALRYDLISTWRVRLVFSFTFEKERSGSRGEWDHRVEGTASESAGGMERKKIHLRHVWQHVCVVGACLQLQDAIGVLVHV